MPRSRLDAALVERGHFESRSRAQAAVIAGLVRVDGAPAAKPGTGIAADARIEVAQRAEFVSRGGRKLANALDAFGLEVAGARALDLGASTGGFTDCLLQRGATEVIALDVGYGQLDWRLRQETRVHVMERVNARHLRPEALPYAPDLVTADLSFIGVGVVWPAVAACLAPSYRALVLAKPQFEVGREGVGSGGVVRDPERRAEAVRSVARALDAAGATVAGVVDSGLPGPRGNHEYFVCAVGPADGAERVDLDAAIRVAVGAA